jgi:hypothetical protein
LPGIGQVAQATAPFRCTVTVIEATGQSMPGGQVARRAALIVRAE